MQAQGIDGVSKPLDSIEDMAQVYIHAIKQVQPRGPYFLIGYSLGGLVTFEMARRLSSAGDRVSLLAMVDSYPHPRRLSPRQRVGLFTRRTGRLLSRAFKPEQGQHRPSDDLKGVGLYRSPVNSSFAPALRRVRNSAHLALKRYEPQFYEGTVKFVRAEVGSDFPDDSAPIWAQLAAGFDVETVPGDHLSMLTTHFKTLASVLTRDLKAALSEL